jgi:hypothetical protein
MSARPYAVLEVHGILPPDRSDGLPPHFIDLDRLEALILLANKDHCYVVVPAEAIEFFRGCSLRLRPGGAVFANGVPLERVLARPDPAPVPAHVPAVEARADLRPRAVQPVA